MSIEATHDAMLTPAAARPAVIHPAWVRITHWINAVAVAVMIGSGWEIYNASPLFPFVFPRAVTLGGWLAGALLWHFAATHQLHNVSDRLDSLSDKHPHISEELLSISGGVRTIATSLELLVVVKPPPAPDLDAAND